MKIKLLCKCFVIIGSFMIVVPQQATAQFTLYGMTTYGGTTDNGIIFKCTTSGIFTKLVNFDGTNGARPYGSLINASDSNLYGMTESGGAFGYGTIFRLTPSGALTTLFSFNNTDGASPFGSLLQATDGNLYGMTWRGGTSGDGTLFKCTISGAFTTLVNFNDSNGSSPFGSLIQASDGNLYGMTSRGGISNYGTIFKCTLSGNLTTIVKLDYTTGEDPWGSLVQAGDGNLYGTTLSAGLAHTNSGSIFQCTTSGVMRITDFNFSNGANSYGTLVQATDSNLYGMALYGGTADSGILFRYTTAGALTTLVSFTGVSGQDTGAFPTGSLIQASDGNLYGITTGLNVGDTAGYATIFKCTTSGTLTTLVKLYGDYTSDPSSCSLLAVPITETGIDDIKVASTVNLYPNPNNGNFTIALKNVNEAAQIEVYNMLEEKVYQSKLNSNTAEINLSSQSQGIYLYRVLDNNNTLLGSGKEIIQH